tara:strand:+ start:227 stop:982 length:756 start_codon:yes stop_codon:yes gene_type:complete
MQTRKIISAFAMSSILCGITFFEGASAEERKRWYISIGAGGSRIENVESKTADYTVSGTTLSSSEKLEIEDSFGYGGGIGYYLGSSESDWRLELNYMQADTEVDFTHFNATYSGTTASVGFDTNGDADISTYMLSLNKDFPSDNGWTPYVGVGVGRATIDAKDVTFDATELGDALEVDLGTTTILEGDSSTVWAYQLRGGIAKEISDNIAVFTEVNYSGTEEFTGGSGDTAIKWKGVSQVSYFGGLRYKLF